MKFALFLQIFFIFVLIGCGAPQSSSPNGGTPIAILPGPPEETYCSGSYTFSNPITITGQATYQARVFDNGLGDPGSPKPIRYAEVMVKNSAGTLVQCAHTNLSGNYSFQMPNDGATYYIHINSRANTSDVKAAVLDSPETNRHYSMVGYFVANNSKNLETINATVSVPQILGGAFNIFDQIVSANIYLKDKAGNCSSTHNGCLNFTVAPKVQTYWKAGVNPAIYINSSNALSFYLPGYSRMFILGGRNGNTTHEDTDHFDNSVILHEYGHFIEDVIFASNSPGGGHDGNSQIDARLAWSEGFGNFFQAAVLYGPGETPYYVDTIGNKDGITKFAFNFNLETGSNDVPYTWHGQHGEGHFREFAITRYLWDALDTTQDTVDTFTDNVANTFHDIWAALTKTSGGMNQSSLAFRNVGDFNVFQSTLPNATDYTAIRGIEKMVASTKHYAQYVTTGSTCDYTISPYNDGGTFAKADWFRNNGFFHLKISSTQSATISLIYNDSDEIGQKADLDLYIYNKSARYGVLADMVGRSEKEPSSNVAQEEVESVSVTLAAGDYLINVRAFTTAVRVGTPATYKIKFNGSELCPSNLP